MSALTDIGAMTGILFYKLYMGKLAKQGDGSFII